MKKILITYAVKEEFVPVTVDGYQSKYVHTGVGKTRSAMHLTRAICEERPDMVLNMGTAGTIEHSVGDIFICRRFVDRDYHSVQLPGIEYEIDFTPVLTGETVIEKWLTADNLLGTCNTGDSFVTEIANMDGDVVDMESFAQALVCKEFNVPFVAIKYVTDIIGQNSVKHWEDKLSDARKGLEAWFEEK